MSKAGQHKNQRKNRDQGDKEWDGFRSTLPRPDLSVFKKQISQHDKAIETYNKEMSEIRSKQDKIRNEGSATRQEFESAKKLMSKLMDAKKALHVDKNSIEASREAALKKVVAAQEKEKAAKAAIKFSSVEAIDKQIKQLEMRQARTSMSLTDEKQLMKEIKALNLSKKNFSALDELKNVTDRERSAKAGFDKKFTEKNAEIREVYKKIDAQKAVLDGLNSTTSETNKQWPELKKRMEELRGLIDAEIAKNKDLRLKIKEKEEVHAAAVAEEKKKYKEELAERKKKEEEEELARHPYEEEMTICDVLISHLSAKYVPKAGMLMSHEDEVSNVVVTKKKGKKKGGQNKKDGITHSQESLVQFSSINVTPPMKISSVCDVLKELEEKKKYYDGLERGAIRSLKSIRAQQKNEDSSDGVQKSDKKSKKSTVFNLESQTEYPDL